MIWWILLVAVLALALLPLIKRLPVKAHQGFPYKSKAALFTPAERSFLGVLDRTLGSHYRVMGKVRIADLITVTPMANGKRWQSAFNKISLQHFDFVLCDKADLSPVAAIELDDKSHSARKRRARDEFITGVCQAAALLLIRIPARRAYTVSDIERLVVNRLAAPVTPSEATAERLTETSVEDVQVAGAYPTFSAGAVSQAETVTAGVLRCPNCTASMILRRVRKGPRAGERLWGCSEYPRCRGILPYNIRAYEERTEPSLGETG